MREFLPKTTGPHVVGCTDIVTDYGPNRSLFRFYYPTHSTSVVNSTNATQWLPEPHYANGYVSFTKMKRFGRWFFNWLFSSAKVPAIWNGPFCLPENKRNLPLLVFSHGLCANRATHSAICSDLASHGVLVAAVEHADESASSTYYLQELADRNQANADGNAVEKKWIDFRHIEFGSSEEFGIRNEQVHKRADECSDVLTQIEKINKGTSSFVHCEIDLSPFKNAVDFDKCAVMGHSFGGGTTITALSQDPRFKVGVGLDAWMFPLDKEVYKNVKSAPILLINAEKFYWPANIADMRKLDADTFNSNAERYMTTIVGTVHASQSDFPLLVGSRISSMIGLSGPTDAHVAHDANNKLAFGFIGKHLNLEFAQSVEDVIEAHKNLLYLGSNVEVDEERIKDSKEALRML